MTDSGVKDMVVRAWENARKNTPPADNRDKRKVHSERSAGWVGALAEELEHRYENDDSEIRVFWKGREDQDFGRPSRPRHELLFDVAVCQVKQTVSIQNDEHLYFVDKCLWLVESELANDSKEIIVDLSKLVMGFSEMKLFVAGVPLSKGRGREEREKLVLRMCKEAADRCGELFYFCFIPYPEVWNEADTDEYGVSLWLRKGSHWHKL